MFFSNLPQGVIGSRCPIGNFSQVQRPASARTNVGMRPLVFKPIVPIDTYQLHKTLFDIAKDEIIASSVLE